MSKGLQKKFLILIFILNIIPLLIQGIFTTGYSFRTILDSNKKIASQDLEKMAELDSGKITEFVNLLSYIRQEERIFTFLQPAAFSSVREARTALSSFMQYNIINYAVNYPYEYVFVTRDHTIFTNQAYISEERADIIEEHVRSAPWILPLSGAHNTKIWMGLVPRVTAANYQTPYVYLAANIFDGVSNIGYVAIGFHPQYLWKNLTQAKLTDDTNIYITDDTFSCLYEAPENKLSFSEIPEDFFSSISDQAVLPLNGTQQLILTSTIRNSGLAANWRMISITPVNGFSRELYRNLRISVLLLLLAILGIGTVAFFMHSYIFRPLLTLQDAMKSTVEEDFNVALSDNGTDEIASLFSGFQYMQRQLKKKIQQIQENEQEKKRVEVQMLQAQINPHFICNSLNTIRVMADMNEDHAVSKSLQALNHLVRHYLHNETSIIPLSEEIEHLREYLYLQKLRYHNSFSYQISVDEPCGSLGIMKLLLQPLVENCIVHGFSDRSLQGYIDIRVFVSDETLNVIVKDNGCGIPEDEISAVMSGKKQSASHYQIGVTNVQKRIQACYGEDYGITIASDHGTTVTVRLPLLTILHSDLS